MQAKRELSQSLSFNNYSNRNQLAEIADRVVEEFRFENGTDDDFFVDDNGSFREDKDENEDDDDDEFEFSFVKESEISPVAADEIFYNGQIRPIYPIFNRDLLSNNNNDNIIFGSSNSNTNSNSASGKPKTIRLPLRKLFLEEEREANSSCSSSEADDLESIPAGTYCVWRPKETENSCKKSNSTGSSSKRWKFRNLLYRSNSGGKDTFVFLTPSFKKKENKLEKPTMKTDNAPPKGTPKSMNYVKNGGEKRKTYLPYRQDLVGFFANMNGMSKNNVLPL